MRIKKLFSLLFLIILVVNNNSIAVDNRKKDYEDLSIIIPSCDKYSELWAPMTTLLFKNWSSLMDAHKYVPIYLVSNFENFIHPRIINIKVGEDKSWSDNMLKALEQVKTKYILIILDDYILSEPVNEKKLSNVMQLMKKTNGAYTELIIDIIDGGQVEGYPGIRYREKFGQYRTSLQVCVWDREILQWLLKPGESAWDFELHGNIRSQGVINPFYIVDSETVFNYRPGGAVWKSYYISDEVDYINNQGIYFAPKKMPIIVLDKNNRFKKNKLTKLKLSITKRLDKILNYITNIQWSQLKPGHGTN